MRQFIFLCDRCKKVIEKDAYRLYVGIVDPETNDSPECYELNKTGDAVFCMDCLTKIDNIVASAMQGEAPKKEIKKKVEKKQIVDGAKLQAMRDSGMTLQEIAEKVGCCQQTVLNRLNAMKKK